MSNIEIIDPIGKHVYLEAPARRIISLVPSQTEVLADLGLDDEIVGITRFCVHPEGWLKKKVKVGGTKNVNLKRVRKLQPDLVLANKEENVKEQVEEIRTMCPVWTSDVKTPEDAIQLIGALGQITGKTDEARKLEERLMGQLKAFPEPKIRKSALYLIWKDPWMAAGGDTYIHQMMGLAGLDNVLVNVDRYPEIRLNELNKEPEVVLLSSEPYAFNAGHIEEVQRRLPSSLVILVDGEMFSWYGSRIQYALPYLMEKGKQWGAF